MFILMEQMMNGTVTLSVNPSIVKAKSFTEAKEVIIEVCKEKGIGLVGLRSTDEEFTYRIEGDPLFIHGRMKNKAPTILKLKEEKV